jgi:hypothetical protein
MTDFTISLPGMWATAAIFLRRVGLSVNMMLIGDALPFEMLLQFHRDRHI